MHAVQITHPVSTRKSAFAAQYPAHDSPHQHFTTDLAVGGAGPVRLARPSPYGTCIHYSLPASRRTGSQFTSAAFTGLLLQNVAVSMDGRGSWRDNVFVERLWRSVKYEEVYLRAYDRVSEARASRGRYLDFYDPASQHPSVYAIEGNRVS
jgi:transposase InsO family protein